MGVSLEGRLWWGGESVTILTKQQLMDTFGFRADVLRSLVARGMPHLKVSARVSAYVLEEVVEWLRENPAGVEAEVDPEEPGAAPRRAARPRPRARMSVPIV